MLQADRPATEVTRGVPNVDSNLLTKSELAGKLGWSRPKLDRRLETDLRFPVVYRGGKGNGRPWQFDWDAVQDYLDGHTESAGGANAIGESSTQTPFSGHKKDSSDDRDVTNDDVIAVHYGEETAKSRLVMAQAAMQEDKLRIARSQLVQLEDLKASLSAAMLHLSNGLDSLPEKIVQHLNLPTEHSLTIRELINQLRTSMVLELQKTLQTDG